MPPSPSASACRLVFGGKQEVHLEPFELAAPGPDEVRIKIHLSLMSTGTENIVFNRLFDPGTHWDNWIKYPFYPGYSAVGEVQEVGANVDSLRVGDRVAGRINHRSHEIVQAATCIKIPAEIPWEDAVWFSLAKIAFQGVRAAEYRIGDSVLIIGAGPIGQMALRWARADGVASIIVVDALPQRLALARKGGATAAISASIAEAREEILQANNGKLPRVVMDSTGNAAVFTAALGLAADRGRVVILGDTGTPARQSLTSDVILRGLSIVGAHDGHNTTEWNDITISGLFYSLAATGRFNLEDMNTHSFKPSQCAEAYATANRDRAKTMGILFDWRDL